ncbi:TetR/AcrR family transcriptional regulator C-terminal domain-containing protein [Salsuginibacillus kocurii]|uniref:TetR/AcrR family transcriptional regulator C-terminal domain-containing protein n=1 Tax=Salsuginibacillus kocurii TaxID=427078 RepID=UPI0003619732|nr:TetR/AcrR family transcriptional regulator C-terminal domain-containing protein [Salsuginibacillus kocurii]
MSQPNQDDRQPVTKSQITHTALDLLEEEGIKKLSIRKIADRLDIKGASLYWHFKNKRQLMEFVSEEICKKVALPDPASDWEKELVKLATNYRHVLLHTRDSAVVLVETPPTTPYRLELIEKVSELFKQSGMEKEDVFSASWMLDNYITSFVIEEYRYAQLSDEEVEPHPSDEVDLPFDFSLPNMDNEFQFGLEVLMAGFKSKIRNEN